MSEEIEFHGWLGKTKVPSPPPPHPLPPYISSCELKTSEFSFVLCTCENSDVFNTVDENIFGIHLKKVNILCVFFNKISL